MSETPTLDDINKDRSQEIGKIIRDLEMGDRVKITNNAWDFYAIGNVVEKGENDRFYRAIVEQIDGEQVEIHANWRDIPPESNDQETPYTGAIIEPFNDTAPSVTDIEVLNK